MITNTQLQNLLNDNDPSGLNGPVANEMIMRVLRALSTALAERTSTTPSGEGIDLDTLKSIESDVQNAQIGTENVDTLPDSVPAGTYLLVGQVVLRGTTLDILSPGGVIAQLENSDGSVVVIPPLGAAAIQVQTGIEGPFASWSISGGIIVVPSPMNKVRMIVTFPFTGTLDVFLEGKLIPLNT
jgi:hypothetical protein